MDIERIKELIQILNKASKTYYQEDREVISNFEYDKLYDELVILEEKTKIIYPNSPTIKIGFEILSSLEKVEHETQMLSLDKTKDISKLKSFLENNEGILSWKLDGLTIVLTYIDGKLFQGVTRGNGYVGEDVTHNVNVFKNVPKTIKYKEKLTIRGEAVIKYSDFDKINSLLNEDEDKYKNPRNLCSGTVRQLNSEIVANRNVHFFPFSIVSNEKKKLKSEELKWLNKLGFDSVEFVIVNQNNLEMCVLDFESRINKNEFGSDGLVLTFNNIEFSNSLGSTSKFPKDSIAFKWEDEVKETKLLEIEWSTSRTGLINPIGIFEPVELEGTTVQKASLHNLNILEELELGIGDEIEVYKANMIIPQILSSLTKGNNIEIPKTCSVCGGATKIIKPNETKLLYCTNPNCSAQIIKSLTHFTSRDAMNIEGLSEATFEKLIENKFIENYIDIFNLNQFEEEIKVMESFGEKSYNNLFNSIEKSKDVFLANFIYALGINKVGLSNAKLLVKHFDFDEKRIPEATLEELLKIDGYGEIISENIVSYFANKNNLELYNKALEIITFKKLEIEDVEKILENMIFVITGSLSEFKNRKELENIIEKLGGKTRTNVNSKTSFLINNNSQSSSSKNKTAKELNVKIITEVEFKNMFNIN